MRILAFETATYFGGVAYVADGVRDCAGPFAPRGASREIMTAANALLARHGCGLEEIDLVVASTGPGLFTGVRVGLSIAKTMVWAGGVENCGLVGVSTLDAVAMLALGKGPEAGDRIIAATDARRGEVYAAAFQCRDGHAERLCEDVVTRPDRVGDALGEFCGKTWVIGDGAGRYGEELTGPLGVVEVFSHEGENLGLTVAELGRTMFESGTRHAPDQVQPHYVRRPDARKPKLQPLINTQTGGER